jgi:cullin-associated NEDD8-dissociated protein 1
MAVSDLTQELQKDTYKPPTASDVEEKIHEVVLIALVDIFSDCRDLAIRALPTLLKKSTKEANKKTLQILCEKIAPTEKTFGPHVDKEERSRHKESASVALKTIGVEGYSKEVSKEFCGKCVPFFDRVLGDANKATVHDDATEILQILCETKAEFVEAKDVSSLIQTTISKIEDKTYGQTSRKRCAGILASLSRAANAKELADVVEKTAARCEKALAEKDVIGCELGAFTLGMIASKDGGGKRLVAESATGGGGGAKKTKKGGANGSLASKTVVPVLSKLCTTLVEKMENNEEADEAFASIAEQSLMALETICGRFGEVTSKSAKEKQLEEILQMAVKLLTYDPNYDDDEEEEDDVPADEMETCQIRTPDHTMKDADDECEDDNDDDDDAYDEDYYSDEIEDDDSWKVRRASARVVGVILCSASEGILQRHHEVVFKKFFKRMKSDREDAVKLECFDALTAAFAAFPKTCESGLTRALVEKARDLAIVRAQQECALEKAKKTSQSAIAAATKRKIASLKLLGKIGRANRRLAFVEASEISRSRLADAIAGAAVTTFTDSGASSEKDSSANLRLEAVAFASEVLRVPTADELDSTNGDALASAARIAFAKKDIDRLTEAVFSCANDPYYKLAAEGLRASACIVRRARPNTNDAVQDKEGCSVLASGSLERAISRLSQQDEDQEVKDASVTLLGDVLTHLGDTLKPAQQKQALDLLLERMQAESTKLVATRNAAKVARHSPAQVNLSGVAGDVIREFASFLRKNDRHLREASINGARALVERSDEKTLKDADCVSFVEDAVTELGGFIENDAHLAAMCVNAFAAICERCAKLKNSAKKATESEPLANALKFVSSSLIQRQALLTLERYFEAAVVARKETFEVIYNELSSISTVSPNDMETDDQAMVRMQQQDIASVRLEMKNRAACIASATLAAGDKIIKSTIATLIEEISDKDGKRQVISLWTLGEIGKRTKIDDSNGIDNTLWKKLEEDNTDEVKTAAAFALGSCAVGNKDAFLPKILETIKTTKKGVQEILKHGALRALREVIIGADGSSEDGVLAGESSKMEYMMSPRKKRVKREDDDVLFKSTQQAWAVVLAKARDEDLKDDAVKADVAEVLGRFVARNHSLVKEIEEALNSIVTGAKTPENATKAALLVDAVRFALVSLPKAEHFKCSLESFVGLVKDADHNCRRAALQLLSVIGRRNSSQNDDLSPLLAKVLPDVLSQLQVNDALIKEIDYGPFKQNFDYGLELRTAAYDFIDVLLTRPKSSLGFAIPEDDIESMVDTIVIGLKDPERSIRMAVHATFEKLCRDSVPNGAENVVKNADKVCELLLETMWTTANEKAVQHEKDQVDELVKSALKVVKAMESIPDVESYSKIVETKKEIVDDAPLAKLWTGMYDSPPHEI